MRFYRLLLNVPEDHGALSEMFTWRRLVSHDGITATIKQETVHKQGTEHKEEEPDIALPEEEHQGDVVGLGGQVGVNNQHIGGI